MRILLAFSAAAAVSLVALFGLPRGAVHLSSCYTAAAWADDPTTDKPPPALPPLALDKEALLLLDGGAREHSPEDRAAQALNGACFVCHANLKHEPLVMVHARAKVSCMECHGPSLDHRDDEDNVTPPDVMFLRATIDTACRECHQSHDVPAAEVVARWRERGQAKSASAAAVCTDCHGRHRLPRRVVRWDKHTRAVIVNDNHGTSTNQSSNAKATDN